MISTSRLADVFVEVADTLVDDFDLVDFLDNLTEHVVAVSGADAVGIVLADVHGALQFMAASNDAGRALELFQIQSSEGPCQDAYRSGEPVLNLDLGNASDLWPEFAPRAQEAGFRSVHAFPMRLRAETIGALNIFGRTPVNFAEDDVRIVQSLADIADHRPPPGALHRAGRAARGAAPGGSQQPDHDRAGQGCALQDGGCLGRRGLPHHAAPGSQRAAPPRRRGPGHPRDLRPTGRRAAGVVWTVRVVQVLDGSHLSPSRTPCGLAWIPGRRQRRPLPAATPTWPRPCAIRASWRGATVTTGRTSWARWSRSRGSWRRWSGSGNSWFQLIVAGAARLLLTQCGFLGHDARAPTGLPERGLERVDRAAAVRCRASVSATAGGAPSTTSTTRPQPGGSRPRHRPRPPGAHRGGRRRDDRAGRLAHPAPGLAALPAADPRGAQPPRGGARRCCGSRDRVPSAGDRAHRRSDRRLRRAAPAPPPGGQGGRVLRRADRRSSGSSSVDRSRPTTSGCRSCRGRSGSTSSAARC